MLPSAGTLLLFVAIVTAVFASVVNEGVPMPATFAASFLPAVLAALTVSRASKSIDGTTIATFRRSTAAVLSGHALWLVCVSVGEAYSSLHPGGHTTGNSLVFGAFVCAGFEVMVINGAFVRRTGVSVLLGAIHPAFAAIFTVLALGAGFSAYVFAPGVAAFVVTASFPQALKRKKTSKGHDAVTLFQAFMKTWADDEASGLESIISAHAEMKRVSSKVLRFGGGDDIFFVLPGVHPGPFYPVGSYNLPGLLFHSFNGSGNVFVLHGPGGHENNLATNADAKRYSDEIKAFAVGMQPNPLAPTIRGPSVAKVGKATAAALAFNDDVLLTVSFAPYGSDDLEAGVETELAEAVGRGRSISVIDAHNSIEAKREVFDSKSEEWGRLMRRLEELPAREFTMGYAHSGETGFAASGDITENGVSVAVIETGGMDWVLVLADSNNAVPSLREATAKALESAGYTLLELCTSDSHDLAARGLTVGRGYHALGEVTPPKSISALVVELAGIAKSRLRSRTYCSGSLVSEVSVFGVGALDEFAELTQRSSRMARAYAVLATVSTVVLLASSLFV